MNASKSARTRRHAPGSAPGSALRFSVSDLVHRPGAMRRVERSGAVPGLTAAGVSVPADEPIDLDLRFEGVAEGIVVSGFVSGRWAAECRRCLEPVSGPFALEVHELFEPQPMESETYVLEGDEIDLEQLTRDVVVLNLPSAPLCSDECLGLCPTCGADRNADACDCPEAPADPRWSALDELRFQDR